MKSGLIRLIMLISAVFETEGVCLSGALAHALDTTSPRDRPLVVRERSRWTVRVEKRETHGLTCGLLDCGGTLKVVEVRCGEACCAEAS
jgi:hypothetical protein